MNRFLGAFPLLIVAMSTGTARADAIEGPPACPEGSRGASSHSGTWCAAAPCASDSECGESMRCVPWRVCTRVSDVPPGGHGAYDRPLIERTLVVGSCAQERACRGDEEPPPSIAGTLRPGAPTCTNATFCVPAALAPMPPRGAGAGDPGTSSGGSASGTLGAGATGARGTGSGRGLLGGCGCRSVSAGHTAAWSLALAAVAAAFLLRRRK